MNLWSESCELKFNYNWLYYDFGARKRAENVQKKNNNPNLKTFHVNQIFMMKR